MEIVTNNLEYIEKTYLTQIEYKEYNYAFIVKNIEYHYRKDLDNLISIKRAKTMFDCGKKLKKSIKKKMKKMIEDSISSIK